MAALRQASPALHPPGLGAGSAPHAVGGLMRPFIVEAGMAAPDVPKEPAEYFHGAIFSDFGLVGGANTSSAVPDSSTASICLLDARPLRNAVGRQNRTTNQFPTVVWRQGRQGCQTLPKKQVVPTSDPSDQLPRSTSLGSASSSLRGSSSTLTSLKVITRTLLTNRADR